MAAERRFFDKVLKDANASFSNNDATRFLTYISQQHDDKVELLYRLAHPKVCPAVCRHLTYKHAP